MDVFVALSDPTRRTILEILAGIENLPSSDIAKHFRTTPSAISQHLKVLRDAKLVRMNKNAQQRLYSLDPTAMMELENWMKHLNVIWNQRFDRLETVLNNSQEY